MVESARFQYIREKREKEKEEIDKNKLPSFIHLSDQYISSFRSPKYQGLFEGLIPIYMFYVLASHNHKWIYFYNSQFIYIMKLLKYFQTRNQYTSFLEIFYLGYYYYFYQSKIQVINYLLISIGINCYIKYFPRTMTFCEIFTTISLLTYYICYGIESILMKDERLYITGNNNYNIIIFSPWLIFALTLFLVLLLRNILRLSQLSACILSLTISFASISYLLIDMLSQKVINQLQNCLIDVFYKNNTHYLLVYMVLVLITGLKVCQYLQNYNYQLNLVRKSFHLLTILLFVPPIMINVRLMVFAFNCVTVLLIKIELFRYFFKDTLPFVKQTFDKYFKNYCDQREKDQDALIVTHIFLLIGCGLPVTLSYILLDGGFFDNYFKLFALSGVLFLGIGDTVVILSRLQTQIRPQQLVKSLVQEIGHQQIKRHQKDHFFY